MKFEWPQFLPYYSTLRGCENSIEDIDETEALTEEVLMGLYTKLAEKINETYEEGDLNGMVKFGLRKYLGIGIKKNEKEAIRLFLAACKPDAPERTRGFAYSCLAYVQYEKQQFATAAKFANEAAELGFRSPSVLRIAQSLEGYRLQSPFNSYTALWRVFDARTEEVEELRRKRQEHDSRGTCHNPECSLSFAKAVARKCAGACAGEEKAYYCSNSCQKQDWPQHKSKCKKIKNNNNNNTQDKEKRRGGEGGGEGGGGEGEQREEEEEGELQLRLQNARKGYFSTPVDVGGGKTVLLTSQTLTADSLKDVAAKIGEMTNK